MSCSKNGLSNAIYTFITSRQICEVCQLECSTWQNYCTHLFAKHPNYCHTCGKQFKYRYQRDLHITEKHNHVPCDECNEFYVSTQELKEHYRKEHAVSCSICNLKLFDEAQRNEHVQLSHSFHCEDCNEVFQTVELRDLHKKSCHPSKCDLCMGKLQVEQDCVVCNKTLKTKADLFEHYKLQHGFKKCSLCEEIFNSNPEREEHYKMVHHSECFVCGSTFRSEDLLNSHVSSVHYKCELCNKAYNSQTLLQNHCNLVHLKIETGEVSSSSGRTSSGETGNACSVCEGLFNTELALVEHFQSKLRFCFLKLLIPWPFPRSL